MDGFQAGVEWSRGNRRAEAAAAAAVERQERWRSPLLDWGPERGRGSGLTVEAVHEVAEAAAGKGLTLEEWMDRRVEQVGADLSGDGAELSGAGAELSEAPEGGKVESPAPAPAPSSPPGAAEALPYPWPYLQ